MACRGFFARPAHSAGPSHLADVRRHRCASIATRAGGSTRHEPSRETLGDYLDDRRFGSGFRDHFLIPITSAVWSTAPERILDFPVDYLLRFLDNHGLIGLGDRSSGGPSRGGSRSTSSASSRRSRLGAVRSGDPVVGGHCGRRRASRSAPRGRLDRAVRRGRHGDPRRRRAGRAPRRRRARAGRARRLRVHDQPGRAPHRPPAPAAARRRLGSWNVDQAACRRPAERADHDLPHEPAAVAPRPDPVLRVGQPGRPGPRRNGSSWSARSATRCTRSGRSTRRRRSAGLQGHRGTWYAGAHLGYGFHEDGCRSGFEVAELLVARSPLEQAA